MRDLVIASQDDCTRPTPAFAAADFRACQPEGVPEEGDEEERGRGRGELVPVAIDVKEDGIAGRVDAWSSRNKI